MNPLKKHSYLRLALFLAAISPFAATAQTEEFISPSKKLNENHELKSYEDKMRANDLVVKLEYIKVGSLKQIQKNGALSFSIPGFIKKIKAKATYVEYAMMTTTNGMAKQRMN